MDLNRYWELELYLYVDCIGIMRYRSSYRYRAYRRSYWYVDMAIRRSADLVIRGLADYGPLPRKKCGNSMEVGNLLNCDWQGRRLGKIKETCTHYSSGRGDQVGYRQPIGEELEVLDDGIEDIWMSQKCVMGDRVRSKKKVMQIIWIRIFKWWQRKKIGNKVMGTVVLLYANGRGVLVLSKIKVAL